MFISIDGIYSKETMPEDFGKELALKMMSELMYESTIDGFMQANVLLMMACSTSKEFS